MMALEWMALLALSILGAVKSEAAFWWWQGQETEWAVLQRQKQVPEQASEKAVLEQCRQESGAFILWKKRQKRFFWQAAAWMAVYSGLWLLTGREMAAVRLLDLFASYGILAVVDGKRSVVPDSILYCFFAGQLLLGAVTLPLSELLQVFLSGALFALAAVIFVFMSRERLGMGDARLLGATAMTAGWSYVLQILWLAMLLSFVYSMVLLVLCRKNIKTEFPFVPFLTGGMLVHFVMAIL